jgi:hypothetical protein
VGGSSICVGDERDQDRKRWPVKGERGRISDSRNERSVGFNGREMAYSLSRSPQLVVLRDCLLIPSNPEKTWTIVLRRTVGEDAVWVFDIPMCFQMRKNQNHVQNPHDPRRGTYPLLDASSSWRHPEALMTVRRRQMNISVSPRRSVRQQHLNKFEFDPLISITQRTT